MTTLCKRLVTLSVVAFSWGVSSGFIGGFHLILSPSIPPGIYRETNEPVTRGALVVACLPLEIARFAKERGYLPFGFCEGWVQPVIKVVGAVEGDVVEVHEAGVSINSVRLENSAVMAADSKGRALFHVEFRQYQVEKGQVWLFSTHVQNAWDSRYFGSIEIERVISAAQPVWVVE
jgi:conjugative transfer signal peptidase TraF